MKRACVALLAFSVLAAGVLSKPAYQEDPKPDKPDTSCYAFASLSIQMIGPGYCEGKATANCTVLDDSRTTKDDVIKTWFTAGVCDDAAQEKAAADLADSVGTVWATAISNIKCTGRSFGCGWSMADPSAWGASFAEMLVEAAEKVIKTGAYTGLEKFCPVDLLGSEIRLGKDANKALDSVCKKDGATVESFHEEYAKATKEDILAAMKIASSGVCGEWSEGSQCNPEKKHVPADIPVCPPSTQRRCCNPRTIGHGVCVCFRCHNPLRLEHKPSETIWRDAIGGECKCPPAPAMVVVS
ncbi:hypothetical protein BSKO_08783 [Bryopsis sp. KO-2023]|nr:hypothetical protein BSKO_08783 [Bryopsis sp. KO-2023]